MTAEQLADAHELAKGFRTPFPGQSAEYARAREKLLAEEIEFRRAMTRVAEQRRSLPPGPAVEKDYRFRDAAEGLCGRARLARPFLRADAR